MRYTLKQLEYFVAAADAGSIKSAAKHVNISQPSVSTAISDLEKIFDTQLFIRHHARGLSLTPSGRALAREARLLLRQAISLHSVMDDADEALRGELSVGCLVTLAPMIVPELVRAFGDAHPDVTLRFSEGDPASLADGVEGARIDLAITYDLTVPDTVRFEPLVSLSPHVLLAPTHPLAACEMLTLEQLASHDMVLLDLPYSRQYFLDMFERHGVSPTVVARSASQEVVRTMVANEFGFTIANVRPRNLVALDGRELVSVALEASCPPVTVGIMTLPLDRKPRVLAGFEAHCRRLISPDGVPGMNVGTDR